MGFSVQQKTPPVPMAQEATCIAVPLSFITQSPVTAANRRISTLLSLPDALHAGFPWDRSQPAALPLWPVFSPRYYSVHRDIYLPHYIITAAKMCQGCPPSICPGFSVPGLSPRTSRSCRSWGSAVFWPWACAGTKGLRGVLQETSPHIPGRYRPYSGYTFLSAARRSE